MIVLEKRISDLDFRVFREYDSKIMTALVMDRVCRHDHEPEETDNSHEQ